MGRRGGIGVTIAAMSECGGTRESVEVEVVAGAQMNKVDALRDGGKELSPPLLHPRDTQREEKKKNRKASIKFRPRQG
jgi:hypothetical protein